MSRHGMLLANVKNMKSFFEDYMAHDGDWDVKSLKALDQTFRATTSAISMRPVRAAMELADKTMHGHGVEEIVGFKNSSKEMTTVAHYVNMGDTYASTIIYDCLADKFYVGTYGDWLEWREGNEDYGLGEND
ncbi:hypothetical protein M0R72_00765 [Candidatus Pacearchaeota archaeon]|nr:hypothetical protein [Candidatus Pacearchaeota archaeon]